MDAEKFARLLEICREILPGTIPGGALEDSLRYLADDVLTQERIAASAHRLAGNLPRLRARRPVGPWRVQHRPEWVPMQILAVRPLRGGRKHSILGAQLTCLILAGTPCPLRIQKWWSFKQCRYFARFFGFTRWRPNRPASTLVYTAAEQLVNLRFYGLIEPDLCQQEPDFRQIRVPASVLDWNREILRRRARVLKGYECPFDKPRALPCHFCAVGYDKCPAGTHRKTYETRACRGCQRKEAYYDPERPGLCVACQNEAAMART